MFETGWDSSQGQLLGKFPEVARLRNRDMWESFRRSLGLVGATIVNVKKVRAGGPLQDATEGPSDLNTTVREVSSRGCGIVRNRI